MRTNHENHAGTAAAVRLDALRADLETLSSAYSYGRVTGILGMMVEVGGLRGGLSVGGRCIYPIEETVPAGENALHLDADTFEENDPRNGNCFIDGAVARRRDGILDPGFGGGFIRSEYLVRFGKES